MSEIAGSPAPTSMKIKHKAGRIEVPSVEALIAAAGTDGLYAGFQGGISFGIETIDLLSQAVTESFSADQAPTDLAKERYAGAMAVLHVLQAGLEVIRDQPSAGMTAACSVKIDLKAGKSDVTFNGGIAPLILAKPKGNA